MLKKGILSLASLYRPYYTVAIVQNFAAARYSLAQYVRWYMHTNNFTEAVDISRRVSVTEKQLIIVTGASTVALTLVGLAFIVEGFTNTAAYTWFGAAIIFATPLVCAVLLPVYYVLMRIIFALYPKKLGKRFLCILLEAQVKRLRKKYTFSVIAVAGSVGKTSTKLAIAQTLAESGKKVQYQQGNYNDRITVPLVIFGQGLPSLFNVVAWAKILRANKRIIQNGYPYSVVVLELGTDAPGQIAEFSYLHPDIAVITAVAAEHMEYFGTLDAVAQEELTLTQYSKKALVNIDDVAGAYLKGSKYIGYGLIEKKTGYFAKATNETISGQTIEYSKDGKKLDKATITYIGPQGRKIVLAAIAAADLLHVPASQISKAVTQLEPFAGRMQRLAGIKDSIIIDDTYNAAPAAVEAALAVLHHTKASQRIAVLGSMNELGDHSVEAHKVIGNSIDASKVDLVVTIGVEARDYLAPAAKEQGCTVESFLNPHDAGEYVEKHLTKGGVILFKGSQNGVFSEEAIKPILKHKTDAVKLVRQSESWMKKKRQQFTLPA